MKTGNDLIDATQNGIKDAMWTFFWAGKMQANLPMLEELCYRLIRAVSQKTSSSRELWADGHLKPTTVDWDRLDTDLLMIAMEATALILDPRFPALKDAWDADKTADQLLDDFDAYSAETVDYLLRVSDACKAWAEWDAEPSKIKEIDLERATAKLGAKAWL